MRTVERFAFIFGIVNLALGAMSMFSPFVREKKSRNPVKRLFQNRSRGLINTREGMLLGGLGAVNPPHAIMHSALGAAGLATRPYSRFARGYMWLTAGLFAALAIMGWTSAGTKPGIHKMGPLAVDKRDNIIHSIWAAAALLFAVKPDLFSGRMMDDIGHME
jgi:hypothetical protein